MWKFFKRAALGGVVVLLGLIVVLWVAKARMHARTFDGYDPAAPLNAEIRSDEVLDDFRRIDFVFDGRADSDDPLVRRVPTTLCAPVDDPGPWPTLIFLHGIGQRRDFVEEIAAPFVEAGFAIVSSDQYTRGERSLPRNTPALEQGLALRTRAALNVLETRRLIDYLETRDDIAHDRIYLMGASFGAVTGSNAAAFDERIAGAVLCYGGGHIPTLIDSDVIRGEVGSWIRLVRILAAAFFGPLDPVQHVHRIAPRPILVQGGSFDQLVPAAATKALYDAAGDPKELVIYDSDHIGLDPDHVVVVLSDTLQWLLVQDATRQVQADASTNRVAVEGLR